MACPGDVGGMARREAGRMQQSFPHPVSRTAVADLTWLTFDKPLPRRVATLNRAATTGAGQEAMVVVQPCISNFANTITISAISQHA